MSCEIEFCGWVSDNNYTRAETDEFCRLNVVAKVSNSTTGVCVCSMKNLPIAKSLSIGLASKMCLGT